MSEQATERSMREKATQRFVDDLLADCPDAVSRVVAEAREKLGEQESAHTAEMARLEREFEAQKRAAEQSFEARRSSTVQQAVEVLTDMQMSFMEEQNVQAALATQAQIALLRLAPESVEGEPDQRRTCSTDPGTLSDHEKVGETYHFEVTGSNDGSVWGSGPYTSDSTLAVAAVHAGAVKKGETGVVTVKIVSMRGEKIRGTSKNGVSTSDWGSYDVGYSFT